MLAGMSSRQFTEWMAYFELEGLGDHPEYRADLRAGIVAATFANAFKAKGQKAISPIDFIPRTDEQRREAPPQDWQTIHQDMVAVARPAGRAPRGRGRNGQLSSQQASSRADAEE